MESRAAALDPPADSTRGNTYGASPQEALAPGSPPIRFRWIVQLVTGFELVLAFELFHLAFAGDLLVVILVPEGWDFSTLTFALLAVVGIYLAGLVGDLFFSALSDLHLRTDQGPFRAWFARVTEVPRRGWIEAREWMWRSPAAYTEFSGRELMASVCRNSAFVAGIVAVVAVIGLVYTLSHAAAGQSPEPQLWWFFAVEGAGLVGMGCMTYFWLEAVRSFHRLVREAETIGSPVPESTCNGLDRSGFT